MVEEGEQLVAALQEPRAVTFRRFGTKGIVSKRLEEPVDVFLVLSEVLALNPCWSMVATIPRSKLPSFSASDLSSSSHGFSGGRG